MKFRKVVLFVLIFASVLGLTNNLYANEETTLYSEDFTEDYQEWEEIPDDEKGEYLQPLPFSINISNDTNINNDAIRKKAVLKSSTSVDTKYSKA